MTTVQPQISTPFRKLLIANRGEIARRIIRTAHRMGLETVAIHSDADCDALHVREAGSAISIGGTIARNSYLKVDAVLEAARVSGAGAIHPGYGFLAENALFAERCKEEGIVFVGPSPAAIRSMGDKAAAKAVMEQAGVPCVPGYRGANQSVEHLAMEAERIGYPVMIKAVAGGGGRGMRLAPDAAAFADLLRAAQSEAQAAFGNPHVLLERAIIEPRHVEIQIFGDRYGNAVHLGERDCSVQRRHQKIIEESPCVALSPATRTRMGEVATAAVKAMGYEGAGTLEFLLSPAGEFYFMEMNTRLQVEHPVTEMVTGLDLVELQLRVAAGEPLPFAQDDVAFAGHAIEVRVCAEDETKGFLPKSGTIERWRTPPGLRVESAVGAGNTVPPYYDSMIAKLIAYGVDREAARQALIDGLGELEVTGVPTNRNLLKRCLEHPVFIAGGATTGFLEGYRSDLAPAGKL